MDYLNTLQKEMVTYSSILALTIPWAEEPGRLQSMGLQKNQNDLENKQHLKYVVFSSTCPTLFSPVDCSLPGFSICGIFQARVPEWVAISFLGGSSRSKDRTEAVRIAGRHCILWATREAPQSMPYILTQT